MTPYYSYRKDKKLYDFVAHGSAVTCLAIGQKSGRVMVTGGDDAKINLWAIGKANCIMSLNGHKRSIECAKFNHNEDIVGAGSASGAIKLWDLEAAKLIQTLTGHKTNVRCLDFHPYGQFMTSGSFDTSIKLWDYRKKGCILTYKAHSKDVHCLKLSPDGRWLASGGNEGTVILYDIVASKLLTELKGHTLSVTDVAFHPNEFLLSSSSTDGTVKFWDLESFQEVSCTNYLGPVRKIAFHPEGKALLTGGRDCLRVFGWEPTKLYDSVDVNWGKLNDMCVHEDQLIAGTFSATNVSVYMVDIGNLNPFLDTNLSYSLKYARGTNIRQSTRRNFNFDQTNKTCKQLESLESNRTEDGETNGSDVDTDSMAEIYNTGDYQEIFHSKRELNRTPPPPEEYLPNDHNRNLAHSYTISSMPSNKSDGRHNRSSSLNTSTRHISESLNNLHLNQKNNNHLINSNTHYQIANRPNNSNNNNAAMNSNNSTSLSHANSLSGLNHLKADNTPTFPPLSSTSNKTPMISHHHAATPLTPITSMKKNATINPNVPISKVTSVVRPVINDVSRRHNAPISQTMSAQPQLNVLSSLNFVENGHRGSHNNLAHSPTKSRNQEYYKRMTTNASIIGDDSNSGCSSNSVAVNSTETFIIPETRDYSAGLDFNDFLPKHIQQFGYDHQPFLSDLEAIATIVTGHKAAKAGLDYRRKQVQIVLAMWATKDSRTALEYAVNLDEKSVVIDILNVMILKASSWNLDICLIMLPCIQEFLESKYESYMLVGCSALSLILKTFSSLIKNNISAPPGIGVDISREERYSKCMKCYNHLLSARAFVLKRQTLQGKIGRSFRELSLLMQNLE